MNKFSIVIPCYNAEKYIERCLESIMKQTYKNFEVIIINDGSTDRSLDIIEKYKEKNKCIKCVNQKNEGVAAARNNAIKHITGNKFIFIDADDFINPHLLHSLNESIEDRDCDIIRYSANLITANGMDFKKYFCKKFDIMDGKDTLKFFVDNGVRYGPLWIYCYDTNFFLSNKFQFINNKIHEDFYNIYILSKATSIKGIDYVGYNYVKNDKSITSNKDKRSELSRAEDILYIYDYVIDKLRESFKDKIDIFDYIIEDVYLFLDIPLKHLEGEDKKNYIKEISVRKRKAGNYGKYR